MGWVGSEYTHSMSWTVDNSSPWLPYLRDSCNRHSGHSSFTDRLSRPVTYYIIIIIIIKSLINSAAFKKTQTRCRHVIQCYGTGVPSGVVQNLPSTVTKDAGRLVGCSKCLDRKQLSSCDRWLPEAADFRCRRPASSTTGWQSWTRYGGASANLPTVTQEERLLTAM